MAAAAARLAVWVQFRDLVDRVFVPTDAIVADLRDATQQKFKPHLDHVAAAAIVLSTSTATYNRASALVTTIGPTSEDNPLIATSALPPPPPL